MNASPKIYHIVHIDRLPSIIADGVLWCDAEMEKKEPVGTTIGIPKLKRQRRQNPIKCHNSQLTVGECVPFYFCPRSVMLYLIYCQNNNELVYRGGQEPIIHLEADMMKTVAWAKKNNTRWAFTFQNAAAYYFEDSNDIERLQELDWKAINATFWRDCLEKKQAEFLLERSFPWELIERIGVCSTRIYKVAQDALQKTPHRPRLEVKSDRYYRNESPHV